MKVAVVIPALNEAATIRELVGRALQQLPDVYVIDDGSTDGTAAAVEGSGAKLVRHSENRGKAASILSGAAEALADGAEAVITLDGDGQHAPEDIPRLLAAAERQPNGVVIGARLRQREQAPRARRIANGIADFWISWAAGHAIADTQSGFRLYPADVLRIPLNYARRRGFVFESEILIEASRHGFAVTAVPIDTVYHANARPSHFRPVADITRIVLMVAWKLLKWGMYPAGLYRTLFVRG